MKITIICSSKSHPVNFYLEKWAKEYGSYHEISIVQNKKDAIGGDLLFLISCSEIIAAKDRIKYKKVLLIHASDLPKGRGWSPHIWQIINGATEITLSLLEADDVVDSGAIWFKKNISIPSHALWDEINKIIFEEELHLMSFAVEQFPNVIPIKQKLENGTSYYAKRTPEMSKLDPSKSLGEQFDLIRVCDPLRYPAIFEYRGHKYKIELEKIG